jgi:hypothetical protein
VTSRCDQFLAVQYEQQAVVRADAVQRTHVRDSLRPEVSLHQSLVGGPLVVGAAESLE